MTRLIELSTDRQAEVATAVLQQMTGEETSSERSQSRQFQALVKEVLDWLKANLKE